MNAPVRKTTEERRREIAQAALDLAYLQGPGRVSTGMIAARLGLTQPAIYKHFPRKEDIWCAVALTLSDRIKKNITAVGHSGMPPAAALKQLVIKHLELVAENPALPELMTMRDGKKGHGAFQETIQRAMAALHDALEQTVAEAIRTRMFRTNIDPADAASLILGLIQSLVLRMLVKRDPGVLHNDGERLLDLLLTGFSETGEWV